MHLRESLPEIHRLSIVSAAIMLAFALTQLISFPVQLFSFSIFGIALTFSLDFSTAVTALTALLAAAGMDWLILSHPAHSDTGKRWRSTRHWILPIMTTLVLGIAMNSFAGSRFWWAAFVLGSMLLIAVFIAEYNVAGPTDERHFLAQIGLIGLSFALYLLLIIALFSSDLRLYLRLPLIALGAIIVMARSFYLRLGEWHLVWAIVNSVVVSQLAVGLNYLPLSPIQNSLVLVGIAYGLSSFVIGVKESRKGVAFWMEPLVMMGLLFLMGLFGS